MKKRVFSKKYLIFIFLLTPVILGLFTLWVSNANAINTKNKITKDIMVLSSKEILDKLDRNLYERYGDIQAFSINYLAKSALMDSTKRPLLGQFMNEMIACYVLYEAMIVVDQAGKVIMANSKDQNGNPIKGKSLIGMDLSQCAWFTEVKSIENSPNPIWYSDFHEANELIQMLPNPEQRKGLVFCAPIKNENHQVVGYWYNLASYSEIILKIGLEMTKELQQKLPDAQLLVETPDRLPIFNSWTYAPATTNSLSFIDAQSQNHRFAFVESTSKGAYTYAGNGWICVVWNPLSIARWGILFWNESWLILIGTCIILIFGVYLANRYSNQVSEALSVLKNEIKRIAQGQIVMSSIQSADELGMLAVEINTMSLNMKKKVEFAAAIGEGNYNHSFSPASEYDVLGFGLLEMRNKIVANNEAERITNWKNATLSQFVLILRQYAKSTDLLLKALEYLVKETRANQGIVYVLENNGASEPMLVIKATYAYERHKFAEGKIHTNEGLVGQVFMEKEFLVLSNVPKNFFHITSGLGNALPSNVLIMPLKVNEEVLGVLELAYFEPILPQTIEMLEKACEGIANQIKEESINRKTEAMLEEMVRKTNELKNNEEEMRQQMEEMMAIQEEMERMKLNGT